jgi:SAM-dependent methyltransferase
MLATSSEKIEILSVELLDQHRPLVNRLKSLAASLGLEFGWHYLLDLTWIISHLRSLKDLRCLDAGAGTGVLQWFLAENGASVISVDRSSRQYLPLKFRRRFHVQGLRQIEDQDLAPALTAVSYNLRRIDSLKAKSVFIYRELLSLLNPNSAAGQVMLYHQDLRTLIDVPSASQDAVVAVSALEHNPPEQLERVVAELMRVLKPGGILLATLGAAPDQDWFHQPSQGWCYTDNSLRKLFRLPDHSSSNYQDYDRLFTALKNCAELRQNLAKFYFQSGENGMPWGIWDPQYQSVGVLKIKH